MIGIDLSQNSIKLVKMEKATAETYRVVRSGIAYLDVSAHASREDRVRAQKKALKDLKDSCGIKDMSEVVVSLASNAIFIRYLDILKSAKKKDDDFVRFEAKQQIPFPLDEVAWDYFYVRSKSGGNKQAVLMAVKNELLEESMQVIEGARLRTKFVNLGLINVINACLAGKALRKNEVGVLVDVGAESTGIVIYKKGELWLRSFSLGGDSITQAIANLLKIDFAEAEKIKTVSPELIAQKDPRTAEQVKDIIVDTLARIADEIERSMSFFVAEQKRKYGDAAGQVIEQDKTRVIVCGGVCQTAGIDVFLSKKLGVPVHKLSLGSRIDASSAMKNIAVAGVSDSLVKEEDMSIVFCVAIGAALAAKEKLEFSMNFLRNQLRSASVMLFKKVFSVCGIVCIALAVSIFFAGIFMTFRVDKQRIVKIESVLAKYAQFRKDVQKIGRDKDTLSSKAKFFVNYISKRYIWLEAMNEIAKIVPLNIWIEDMTGTAELQIAADDRIELKGVMLSYDDFNDFIANIKRLDIVKDAIPEGIENVGGEFKFTLAIILRRPFEMSVKGTV